MRSQKTTSMIGVALLALLAASVGTPCLHGLCGSARSQQPARMTAACCTEACPMEMPGDCGMTADTTANEASRTVTTRNSSVSPFEFATSALLDVVAVPTVTPLGFAPASIEGNVHPPGPPLITLHSQYLI